MCLSWAFVKFYVCTSFPFGIEGGMWDVIVLIPDYYRSIYFVILTLTSYKHLFNSMSHKFCTLIYSSLQLFRAEKRSVCGSFMLSGIFCSY